MLKKFLKLLLLLPVVAVAAYVWQVNLNYRFETITPGKVYKSAAMPPDRIGDYLTDYHIKTIIDLRKPGEHDLPDPTRPDDIAAEDAVATRLHVRHINIPSDQVPTAQTLTRFFSVLDDPASYPVLIHCHDGTGRAVVYSATYRLEYEHWRNAAARAATRPVISLLWYRSAFADGTPKGDFLMHYRPRTDGDSSTLNQLERAQATN